MSCHLWFGENIYSSRMYHPRVVTNRHWLEFHGFFQNLPGWRSTHQFHYLLTFILSFNIKLDSVPLWRRKERKWIFPHLLQRKHNDLDSHSSLQWLVSETANYSFFSGSSHAPVLNETGHPPLWSPAPQTCLIPRPFHLAADPQWLAGITVHPLCWIICSQFSIPLPFLDLL